MAESESVFSKMEIPGLGLPVNWLPEDLTTLFNSALLMNYEEQVACS
jgi:hypothetical protein